MVYEIPTNDRPRVTDSDNTYNSIFCTLSQSIIVIINDSCAVGPLPVNAMSATCLWKGHISPIHVTS